MKMQCNFDIPIYKLPLFDINKIELDFIFKAIAKQSASHSFSTSKPLFKKDICLFKQSDKIVGIISVSISNFLFRFPFHRLSVLVIIPLCKTKIPSFSIGWLSSIPLVTSLLCPNTKLGFNILVSF